VHLGIEPSTATPNMFSWYWYLLPVYLCTCTLAVILYGTKSTEILWFVLFYFQVFNIFPSKDTYLRETRFYTRSKFLALLWS
jgi:hypothetical protein